MSIIIEGLVFRKLTKVGTDDGTQGLQKGQWKRKRRKFTRISYHQGHTQLAQRSEDVASLEGFHAPMPLFQRTYRAPFIRSGSLPLPNASNKEGRAYRVERM
ncbi:hypothetical protein H0H87_006227 [Tephrocybe sp. NHM501043]|nr:hypothetical protein H0H87_006227 [Tephrocybe sp. NHM501043]